jgi:hypothetical protein
MFVRFYTVIRYLREREAVQVLARVLILPYLRSHVRADAALQEAFEWLRHGYFHAIARQTFHQFVPVSFCHDRLRVQLHRQYLLPSHERHRRFTPLQSHHLTPLLNPKPLLFQLSPKLARTSPLQAFLQSLTSPCILAFPIEFYSLQTLISFQTGTYGTTCG